MNYDDNINFKVNVSHITSEFDMGSNKGKQLPMVANITGNAAIYYNFDEGFNLSLSNQFVGSRYRIGDEANANQKAKSYNIYNTGLNYNLNDFEAFFKMNNILDKNYYHYNSWGSIYPLPGRNFSLNIKYSF
jgi:iron complex outermembrane receptor protein